MTTWLALNDLEDVWKTQMPEYWASNEVPDVPHRENSASSLNVVHSEVPALQGTTAATAPHRAELIIQLREDLTAALAPAEPKTPPPAPPQSQWSSTTSQDWDKVCVGEIIGLFQKCRLYIQLYKAIFILLYL